MIFLLKVLQGEGSRFDFQIVVQNQKNGITEKTIAQELMEEPVFEETLLTDADIKLHIDKRKGFKILLAEDNLINQKVAEKL